MWETMQNVAIGLLAPLGALGLWGLQRLDRSEDREEKRRELKREKAEAVFEEVNSLVRLYNSQSLYAFQLANKNNPEAPPVPSAARVSALLIIYFPNCVEMLDQFETDMRALVEKYGKELREAGEPDPEKIRGIHVLLAYESLQRVVKFEKELRPKLQSEIEKLW